jgi:BNR repeat-like domain
MSFTPAPTPSLSAPNLTGLTQLSSDTFTNASSQHATEVEPSAFAFGSTIVSAFQVGRIYGGGSADIGFATSTNGGGSWMHGVLPDITTVESGSFPAVSDPSVAFDAAHSVWIIASLGVATTTDQVIVSRSPDGMNWTNPIVVSGTADADKNWIACDNTPESPFFGHCYIEWDDPSNQGIIWMSTSTDGGFTWLPAANTADHAAGIGGIPVVQPQGTVVVPFLNWSGNEFAAFTSKDGGASWTAATTVSTVTDHQVAGGLRSSALPSATVDSAGNVYVAWQDCRFRASCSSNDIVMSISTDGVTWTAPSRIPIDPTNSTVDHFIPALATNPATGGVSAHLALVYYFYPQVNCASSTCDLEVGYVSSNDGGSSWAQAQTLVGPMSLTWLPSTFSGVMVGDYVAAVFSGSSVFSVFVVAQPNAGVQLNEAVYTTASGLAKVKSATRFRSARETPRPDAHSDHPPRAFYDLEHRYPIPRR